MLANIQDKNILLKIKEIPMRLPSLLLTFFLLVLSNLIYAELPEHYQSLNASEKQTILWQQVYQSHEKQPLPPLNEGGYWSAYEKLKGLFNLSPSFDYISDEMPEGRSKIIHSNGSVAKFSFQPLAGHPFTGIYKARAIGLVRLSLATAPSDDSYVPGIAIKFLFDNHPSLNLHAMHALDGQGQNWNFFANPFSNKIDHPSSWLLKGIEKIFEWTRSPANELPLDHLAKLDPQGKKIEMPIAPEQIYFVPTASTQNIIDPDSRIDFRLELEKISLGPLYNVYGALDGVEYQIGTIELDSEILASEYGDSTLFFQHQR